MGVASWLRRLLNAVVALAGLGIQLALNFPLVLQASVCCRLRILGSGITW